MATTSRRSHSHFSRTIVSHVWKAVTSAPRVEIVSSVNLNVEMISRIRPTNASRFVHAGVASFSKPFMNCRSRRRNELERQGVRSAALNAWFGHSQAVAERHYEKVTEDDYAEVTN